MVHAKQSKINSKWKVVHFIRLLQQIKSFGKNMVKTKQIVSSKSGKFLSILFDEFIINGRYLKCLCSI